MDKQEFLERITEIGKQEDVAEMRAMLTTLSDDAGVVFDERESLSESNKQYVEDNEKLRQANMKLFLQVGEQRKPEEPEPVVPPKPQRMSFDALFDDKGNIK